MKRNNFNMIKSGILGCVLIASSLSAATRPNILFIYTDDQRYDALSVVQKEQGDEARFPWLKTPNMDRLASEGVRFRNAFVVNSLCSPSRAVNLSGRYNHYNGVASNFRDFPVENITHASLLRESGYTTAYIGKWHMGNQKERPGFDYAASFIGHARYFDPTFIVQGEKVPREGWIDDISTGYAVDYLKKQKGSDKPWLMCVGFKTPHGPFEPPSRTKDIYKNTAAMVVPNFNKPAPYNKPEHNEKLAGLQLDKTTKTNIDYFRCITAVDECLGKIMDAVDENGFRENTVVIYTSDNGFYLGEHGLGDKRSAYDESLRVPFLVRYPALGNAAKGKLCDRMVLNLDLVRSILDFAGVKAPDQIQGRSWKPLLTGDVSDWRKSWFYEYFAESQRNSRVPDIQAVRTENAKIIVYPGHPEWTEMFDLSEDPYETCNLYNNPERKELRVSLEQEIGKLSEQVGYLVPEYTDRPFWWGRPGGPDWKPDATPFKKLSYEPAGVKDNMVVDSVEGECKAEIKGSVKVVSSQKEGKVFAFDGKGYVDIGKPEVLDPTMKAFTVEVEAKIEPDSNGVLMAMGGKSLGYSLAVRDGHVLFAARCGKAPEKGKEPVVVETKKPQQGWLRISGIYCADKQIELCIDGRTVGRKKMSDYINHMPNDSMQIGADFSSPVIEPEIDKFKGEIKRASYYIGEKR